MTLDTEMRETGQETIVAISTPPGRGGIGVVRLSGPGAVRLAEGLVRVRGELGAVEMHGRALRAEVLDPEVEGRVMDDALVTVFHAPRSYTGEDVVEISAHGSPVVLQAMVRGALLVGERLGVEVRLAGPGEFTQRAFLAGRIDLTQAEAVHDLIEAQTLDQARVAAQQLGGALSRRIAPAKEELLHLIALLEAGMDFASGELDDVDVVPMEQIAAAVESVRTELEALVATFHRGQLLRNGASIALVGAPNAGKSSLFNRLLARERAIVTAVPGTTRDTLEESLAIGGIPVRLIDTAGLRDAPADAVEAMGIERTREVLADADVVLLIEDASRAQDGFDRAWLKLLDVSRPHLLVRNKMDLLPERVDAEESAKDVDVVFTSALTGAGLEELRERILALLQAEGGSGETAMLNTMRQQEAVMTALSCLAAAGKANEQRLPHELLLLDLHRALQAVDSLTGVTTTEDILGRIFSTFCIGK